MTQLVEALLEQLRNKSYRQLRVAKEEKPILYPQDLFGFHFGKVDVPGHLGGNLTPNFERFMTQGFDAVGAELVQRIEAETDAKKIAYGKQMLAQLDHCLQLSDEYRETVCKGNNDRLYSALLKIPHKGAESFYEACVFISLIIYFLRVSKAFHIGLGRFDQYMYPFYLADKAKGVTDEEIFETLEAFFVSLNYDTDLYYGVQKGDNGQSMVLGGFDKDGNSVYNELSDMCMKASLELNLIDPKINLRVGKNTPEHVYVEATKLTKQGLGFPQYCNDDVVIPGLIKLGYAPEDARNYVVAACWEFIIPGCGADIPNSITMNFPRVVDAAISTELIECETFEQLMQQVESYIRKECEKLIARRADFDKEEMPLLSLFVDNCIERLTDVWHGGAKYHNYGCHGTGIANAADALAAVKKLVFEEKTVTKGRLLDALEKNFHDYEPLRNQLLSCPKMGNNDDYVDDIANQLMAWFAEHLNNKDNHHGGIWRAGTGSAQGYIVHSKKCFATADGRKRFDPFPSSFSPSLEAKTNGLLSVMQSFTKFDMTDIINGGPLTIEIHDSVLRNDIGIEKTAQLVKLYIQLGGHQLQLNSLNREQLLDAQKHPEKYPNLIVRVWGWSGYFNELDLEYQNHIIRRCQYLG